MEPTSVSAAEVVRALCTAAGRIHLFPGTRGLLVALRDWHPAFVVLSNTTVRNAPAYWQGFRDSALGTQS